VLESQDPNRLLYVGAELMTDGTLEKKASLQEMAGLDGKMV
jgi:hypothetical protein